MLDLLVAVLRLELAHRPFERPPDPLALRVPERRARGDVVEAVEVELDAQAAVVALLGLLAPPEVGVELILCRPDRPVDPLECGSFVVAAPVGARDRQQLERPDLSGARDVGALAQVDERPVLVDARRRHRGAVSRRLRREVVENLDLERLVPLGEEGPPLFRRELAPDEWMVGRDGRRHPLLDRRQVVRRERPIELEVVVEAVGDRRPDAELGAREQAHHRLGHHMGGRVTHRVQLVVGAGVEQLVRRVPLGRLEQRLVVRVVLFVCHRSILRETRNLSSVQDERFLASRGSTRVSRHRSTRRRALVAALTGGSRTGSPVAHGWCLDRRAPPGSQPWPGSLEATATGVSRSSRSGCGGRHWTRTSDLLHVRIAVAT